MTRELSRTYQSLIGFLNVIGAMEGRPQFEMDMDKMDGGVQLITAKYIPEGDDATSKDAAMMFNFSPSLGFAGERFVLASTDQLARELVSAKLSAKVSEHVNTDAHLDVPVLKSVLNDNREQLIARNMLEGGKNREEAESTISMIMEVIDYFQDASIKLHATTDQLNLNLDVRVKQ